MTLLVLITLGYITVCVRFWTTHIKLPPWLRIMMNSFITAGYLSLVGKLWILTFSCKVN